MWISLQFIWAKQATYSCYIFLRLAGNKIRATAAHTDGDDAVFLDFPSQYVNFLHSTRICAPQLWNLAGMGMVACLIVPDKNNISHPARGPPLPSFAVPAYFSDIRTCCDNTYSLIHLLATVSASPVVPVIVLFHTSLFIVDSAQVLHYNRITCPYIS